MAIAHCVLYFLLTDKSSVIEEASRLSTLLLDNVQIVFTSLGAHGALWCQKGELHSNQLHHVLHRADARVGTCHPIEFGNFLITLEEIVLLSTKSLSFK